MLSTVRYNSFRRLHERGSVTSDIIKKRARGGGRCNFGRYQLRQMRTIVTSDVISCISAADLQGGEARRCVRSHALAARAERRGRRRGAARRRRSAQRTVGRLRLQQLD